MSGLSGAPERGRRLREGSNKEASYHSKKAFDSYGTQPTQPTNLMICIAAMVMGFNSDTQCQLAMYSFVMFTRNLTLEVTWK